MSGLKSTQIHEILFCVPIWGDSYISKFLDFVLPSYFTEKNITSLRERYRFKICLLTDEKGFVEISSNSLFKTNLRKDEIEFINIKDLIVDAQYTFTLTMAYARAINSIDSINLNKTLVILANSDFLLSDGSLSAVLNAAESGAQAIYGASLRCKYEEITPILEKRKSKDFYRSRNLVNLTLNSLHPTVTAMTVNNGYQHYKNVRQLFYKVDNTCLLARNFLLCIIGIVPQRHLTEVNSYHDYSFVPELTEDHARYVISDSDNYFAMELQDTNSESQYINFGEMQVDEIADAINLWAMPEHRWASGNEIIFHSKEIPTQIAESQREFGRFFSSIENKLSDKPLSHINHYHWTSGALIWEQKAKTFLGKESTLKGLIPKVRKISFFDKLVAIRHYPISFYRITKHFLVYRITKCYLVNKFFLLIKNAYTSAAYFLENKYVLTLHRMTNITNLHGNFEGIDSENDTGNYLQQLSAQQLDDQLVSSIEKLDVDVLDLIISRKSCNWISDDKILVDFLNSNFFYSNFKISTKIEGRFLVVIFRDLAYRIRLFVIRGRYLRLIRLLMALLPFSLIYVLILANNAVPVIFKRKNRKGSFLHIRLSKI